MGTRGGGGGVGRVRALPYVLTRYSTPQFSPEPAGVGISAYIVKSRVKREGGGNNFVDQFLKSSIKPING